MNKIIHANASEEPSTGSYSVEVLTESANKRTRMDDVAVEAPLEVRFAGKPTTVLMRTPGNDEELVLGFLFNEGIIKSAADVDSFDRPNDTPESASSNVIDVRFAGPVRRVGPDRMFQSSASCGACGKRTTASIAINAPPVESRLSVRPSVLSALPDRLRDAQPTFALTGGVHASGLFTRDGELVAVREDVGRHNALDKLIGWAVSERMVPLDDHVLLLSGRVSYELVQKAVMASIPVLAAVGAPSSMAVDIARDFNVTLVGFLRATGMNVYAHAERLSG